MVKIAPSILAADFAHLGQAVEEAEAAGADYIHLDVMDGHFVPNITLGVPVVASLRKVTRLPLDVHLMIEEPDNYLEAFAQAGADILTVHLEACPHLHRTLQRIHELGRRAGVALNPATPISLLEDVLPLADVVLLMTVNPGLGGQLFIREALPKFTALARWLNERGLGAEIEADGGVDEETAGPVTQAGATVLVAGTSVFRPDLSVGEAIQRLRRSAPLGHTA